MNLISQYSFGYYLLCILLGVIYAFLLYRKDRKLEEFSAKLIALLIGLRLIVVSFIAMLLLAPLLKYFNKTVEKPIVVVALDRSSSMINNGNGVKVNYDSIVTSLDKNLSIDYEVALFSFDEQLYPFEQGNTFEGQLTNYQSLFNGLNDRFINRNLSGLILISDGIYNQGVNPFYLNNQFNFPIYTLATGDTNKIRDARVLNVRNNKITFLGNDFPVEIDLSVEQAKGEEVEISIHKGENEIFRKTIEVNSSSLIETISTTVEARELGMQSYSVNLTGLQSERNVINNQFNFYIDVLDGRQKIAILANNSHPDVASIKRSLEKNENYDIEVELMTDFNKKPDAYDLIILHHGGNKMEIKPQNLLDKIEKDKVPMLLIGKGWNAFDKKIIKSGNRKTKGSINKSYPILNPAFTLFTVSEQLEKQFNEFPPINAKKVGSSGLQSNSILLYQKIGVVETKYPFLAFINRQDYKIGRLFADGIWQWGINDYQINKNRNQFNEILSKTVQYLALKSDRSYFRLHVDRSYNENEKIVFEAQLYNQSYELINEPSIDLSIFDEAGREFKYAFNPRGDAYRLIIPALKAGSYRYEAKTELDGNKYPEKGSFVVKSIQLEQLDMIADHNLLFQLSEKTSGKMLPVHQAASIPELLNSREDINSISYMNESLEEVINLKWIFFLLLGLLSLEWFIRKYKGAY